MFGKSPSPILKVVHRLLRFRKYLSSQCNCLSFFTPRYLSWYHMYEKFFNLLVVVKFLVKVHVRSYMYVIVETYFRCRTNCWFSFKRIKRTGLSLYMIVSLRVLNFTNTRLSRLSSSNFSQGTLIFR